MKRLALATFLLVLAGCVAVPSTKISYSPGTGNGPPTFNLKAPKQSKIDGLEYTRSNNVVSLRIQHYEAANDPNVIQATAVGQVEIIKATGSVVGEAVATGISAYATGGTSLAVPKKPAPPATNAPPQ